MAVVIGFFICWAPFHAQRLLYVYGKNLPRYTEINEKMYYITGCFYYFSATINPILYNVMSARYREAFCETLCGCQSQLDKPRDPYADRCQSITSFNSLQQSTINKHPNQKKKYQQSPAIFWPLGTFYFLLQKFENIKTIGFISCQNTVRSTFVSHCHTWDNQ